MAAMDITLEELQPIVRALGEGHHATALVPLTGGSSQVWRIDRHDASSLVLKTYADDVPWTPVKEARATALLDGFDLPVTQYLAVDETKTVLPVRFALTNFLPGTSVRDFFSQPDLGDLYRQMGELLRQLHGVPVEAYGYLAADGFVNPRDTHDAAMADRTADIFQRFRHFGGDAKLAGRLEAIVAERRGLFSFSAGPVFAHDDMHQGNVLAVRRNDGALRLTGLIDFGNVRGADAVSDLAKCLFCAGHEDPRSREPILDGYGPIPHPEPRAALWLHLLLHRASMWAWLRRTGGIAPGAPSQLMTDLKTMAAEA